MTISLDDLVPIELNDKKVFDDFFSKYPPLHSDYSFTTMICWQDYMKYYYILIDESIIILTKCQEKMQLRPPIGKPSINLEKQVIKLAISECSEPPYGMIDSIAKDRLLNSYPGLEFSPHRDYFDYVYLSKNLVDLSGKKYLKIRNHLNRLKKNVEYSIEPISSENFEALFEFLNRWCLWKDCDKIPLLSNERDALLFCLKHFFELNLSGIVIRIKGEIEAASIFESLSKDTAVIHFEKAIPDYDGLYQVINQEAAKILVNDYQYINRESDMGFPGLRIAKKKYQPDHMVEVYHLDRSELENII